MKDAREPERRPRHPGEDPVFDVVTPTADQARLERLALRQRRYFTFMIPCFVLVLFGFFVPAPIPIRLAALVIAAILAPIAVMLGNC